MGGAETNLYHLLSEWRSSELTHHVICLDEKGVIGDWIERLGIPVIPLRMRRRLRRYIGLIQAYRYMRRIKPDIIHTHMYHANIVGILIKGKRPCIWGIYCSNLDSSRYSRRSRLIKSINFRWSHRPDYIIFNSEAGLHYHIRHGFPAAHSGMIPSGFNTELFRPNAGEGEQIRRQYGIPNNAAVIGYFARLDVMKNHEALIKAIPKILKSIPDTHFILAGRGVEKENPIFQNWLNQVEGLHQIHLLGERHDIHQLYNALDLFVMTSRWGEGLPSVIGEAMASGIPCLVTDVGDNRRLLGDTGMFISSETPEGLADEIIRILRIPLAERVEMSTRARERILNYFQIGYIAQQYSDLYRDILQTRSTGTDDHPSRN